MFYPFWYHHQWVALPLGTWWVFWDEQGTICLVPRTWVKYEFLNFFLFSVWKDSCVRSRWVHKQSLHIANGTFWPYGYRQGDNTSGPSRRKAVTPVTCFHSTRHIRGLFSRWRWPISRGYPCCSIWQSRSDSISAGQNGPAIKRFLLFSYSKIAPRWFSRTGCKSQPGPSIPLKTDPLSSSPLCSSVMILLSTLIFHIVLTCLLLWNLATAHTLCLEISSNSNSALFLSSSVPVNSFS